MLKYLKSIDVDFFMTYQSLNDPNDSKLRQCLIAKMGQQFYFSEFSPKD